MKNRTALSLAVSMAISYPAAVNALGLGELQSTSQLNQPLTAQIDLLSTSPQEIKQLQVKLASADVFSRVGIERPAYLNSLKFRTTVRNGKPVILVSSDRPVSEPFLNFLLEVSWPQGQLLKEYTVLLDPPIFMQSGASAPDKAASVRAEPQSSGVVKRSATDAANAQRIQQQQAQAQRQSVLQQQQTAAAARQAEQQRAFESQARVALQDDAAPAKAATRSTSGKKYRVKRGDTMYQIASKLRYRGTTNNQMMVALFNANPQAFTNNNINLVKTGVTLARPTRSQVKGSSRSAAKTLVKQHYAEWQKFRSGLASTATTQQQTPAATSTASKAATATPKSSGTKSQPSLSVVGGPSKAGNSIAGASNNAIQKKLVLAEEALASSNSKNAELEAKVGKLEAIVRKKDRLITLKNERLARLEAQYGGAGTAAAAQPATPVASEGIDLAGQLGNEEQGSDTILRDSTPDVTAAPQEILQNPETALQNPEPAEAPVTDAGTERLSSPFVDDTNKPEANGLLDLLKSPMVAAIGGGSLLALILGGLFLRRRQASAASEEFMDSSNEDFDMIEDDLDEAAFDDDFDNTISEFQSEPEDIGAEVEGDELDQVLSSDSSLDDDEVLQEADVYIVYGLHEQAEDELKKAIKEKPAKLEYRYKLLENYQVADDAESFVESAKEYLTVEGDNKQELWERIVDLGKKVAPENDMFSEKDAGKAASVFAGVAGLGAAAALAGGVLSSDADDVVSDATADAVSSDDFESMLNSDSGLDDLDLSGIDNDDFNISGVDTAVKDDLDLSEFADLNDSDVGGDFNLDDIDGIDSGSSNVVNFNSDVSKDGLDLNLELDGDSGIDKILPKGSTYGGNNDADDDALSFLNLPEDDQEMQDAHIGTKLDLARAYLDMGDIEGARCTLEEVVVEGNDAQKREAQEMLQQTG